MQAKQSKYKIFTRDMMKYLAIIPMFIGHLIAWVTLMQHPDNDMAIFTELPLPLLLLTGCSLFCPPVMFFFIADGYHYTRNRKKYALRLLLFACITQPFHWLVFQPLNGWWTTNVIFTLFFGLLAIMAWETKRALRQRILLILLCVGGTLLLSSDWLVFGVLMILALHIFRDKPKARLIAYSTLAVLHTSLNLLSLGQVPTRHLLLYMLVMLLCFLAAYLCMTTFYNGRKGKHPTFAKWFFYAFYPVHYLVIYLVKICIDKF